MRRAVVAIVLGIAVGGVVLAHAVFAQHSPGGGPGQPHRHEGAAGHGPDMHAQHMPGQDAFGAIAEIVRILDADPATDWGKVDVERLRQHLIDMNEVVLRSAVTATAVPGGLAMEVTGAGRTEQAIRAMVVPHAGELDRMPSYRATTSPIAGGVRLIVLARNPDDTRLVARIRGLGFAGLMTEGAHHQEHHLAMARGEALRGHGH